MSSSFPAVNRSLRADHGIRSSVVLLLALFLLAAWVGWAFGAKVTRYEVSDSARLEARSAAYPIQTSVSSGLVIIANFQLASVLGRVHVGQPAIVRLDGFPRAQYGTVRARVSRVSEEIRDGKVRVELAVDSARPADIPYQQGFPTSVEVEVERVSPAALILRAASELVDAR